VIARRSFPIGLALGLLCLVALAAPAAAADDDAHALGLRGPRLAFVPAVGGGVAAFTSQLAPFPSFVGLSISQVELSYETPRWGGFLRGGYLSSGEDGRWTAPLAALGVSYRLRGDGEEVWGFVPRGGLMYQRWHANSAGCPVPFFFPDNCKGFDSTTKTPSGVIDGSAPPVVTTIETLGLFFGMRAEIPVSPIFLALGAEMTTTLDLSQSSPGLIWSGQFTLAFALRNHQIGNESVRHPIDPARYRSRGQP
jgi:hypothetical protein